MTGLSEVTAPQSPVVEEEVSEMVRAAAIYMDGVKPDWWQHIDPHTFNMGDARYCICGQNDLRCGEHARRLGVYWHDPRLSVRCSPFGGLRHLEPLWLEEIASRMPDSARLDRSVVERATRPADGRVRSGGWTE